MGENADKVNVHNGRSRYRCRDALVRKDRGAVDKQLVLDGDIVTEDSHVV